MRNTVHSRH